MSDVNTDTPAPKTFNAEAFAMNIAKAMETSGQALAAYLKPREGGEPKDKPPSEVGEVIKTFARRIAADRGAYFVDLAGATIRNISRGVIGVALLQSGNHIGV